MMKKILIVCVLLLLQIKSYAIDQSKTYWSFGGSFSYDTLRNQHVSYWSGSSGYFHVEYEKLSSSYVSFVQDFGIGYLFSINSSYSDNSKLYTNQHLIKLFYNPFWRLYVGTPNFFFDVGFNIYSFISLNRKFDNHTHIYPPLGGFIADIGIVVPITTDQSVLIMATVQANLLNIFANINSTFPVGVKFLYRIEI